MKHLKVLLFFLFLSQFCISQSIEEKGNVVELVNLSENSDIFLIVEEMPSFPSQDENRSILNFLQSLTDQELIEKNKKNCSFYIDLLIGISGEIEGYEILEGPEGDLRKEVHLMINKMPNWTPGKQKSVEVKVLRRININFGKSKILLLSH